ncbi:hypothetical protein [Parashewanella tropica]|uniref:hypothetical protein n=1 Tax=Parashewanella tropica TaxID=2547970 RepID=UPI00105A2CD6|nr:hypothetical protein [Parashewanella tropica]
MTKKRTLILSCMLIGLSLPLWADGTQKKRLKWSPKAKLEQASNTPPLRQDSREAELLQQAKLANQQHAARAERYKSEVKPDWEKRLKEQANQQFKQAKQRTQEQLEQAKAAAKKQKKIASTPSQSSVLE